MKANTSLPWPFLASRQVRIGGVLVSYSAAESAAAALAASRTSVIQPTLRAVGSPLAACDYFAVAAPYLQGERFAPKNGRIGAAGRHVTKNAFILAVERALEQARQDEVADALAAFASDERYAAAIAREAVAVRARARASGVRASVRTAVTRALAACGERAGEFACSEAAACGTGACRFASPAYRAAVAPAGPGKFARPANHVSAGASFGEAAQAAEALAAGGRVSFFDDDAVATRGWAA